MAGRRRLRDPMRGLLPEAGRLACGLKVSSTHLLAQALSRVRPMGLLKEVKCILLMAQDIKKGSFLTKIPKPARFL